MILSIIKMYFKAAVIFFLVVVSCQGNNIAKRSSDDDHHCITLNSQCRFPFTYQGEEYNECTSTDSEQPWCYTGEKHWEIKHHWVNCELCEENSIPIQRCQNSYMECEFPFEYGGDIYYECTSVDHNEPWCYTAGKRSWVNCDYCSEDDVPVQRCLSEDVQCHFPFEYGGEEYKDCTDADHDQLWCYTNEDKTHWANCKTCYTPPPIQRCYSPERTCHFPFVYKDIEYNSCTSVDHNQPWCYTTDLNNDWVNCNEPCVTEHVSPHCLNKTTSCSFPFSYHGQVYNECTEQDDEKAWCMTNLENHWAYCESCSTDDQYPTQRCRDGFMTCHFPFEYKGVTYNECSSVDHDELWCYTNAEQTHWVNCEPCTTPVKRCLDVFEQCHFPFQYKGQEYFSCITEDSQLPWCYTDENNSKWSHCHRCDADSFAVMEDD